MTVWINTEYLLTGSGHGALLDLKLVGIPKSNCVVQWTCGNY